MTKTFNQLIIKSKMNFQFPTLRTKKKASSDFNKLKYDNKNIA